MNSEFRQDIISGDWVVIAPKRLKRPEPFLRKEKRKIIPKKDCPFDNLKNSGNDKTILTVPNSQDWKVKIIPNKFPILAHKNLCARESRKGPYKINEGIGYHDVLITRNHFKNFPNLAKEDALLVFKTLQERYKKLIEDKCVKYVSIFHNWGPKAGASIFHPHFQILSLPIIPPDIKRSLEGSREYFQERNKCAHCVMIEYEKSDKKRVVYENKEVISFTPFVAREPFELRVFPKKHLPYFEDTSEEIIKYIIEALQVSLIKIEKKLGDPDYNLFIHTAPSFGKDAYDHYHWHIEVLPKFSISAGFELGTGIEVTIIDPEAAAKILKHGI
ncbi:MAG: HIT domain-containing protein [Patescibacteria group bacterium]|nr:HIT domain-containing protein [Patescibacteria group bacterium]